MKQKTAEEIAEMANLKGKTILITGCNSGIGYETMRVLAQREARIIGFARNKEKAQKACNSVTKNFLAVACEMSDIISIQKAIQSINEPIDVIIANAGVMWVQEKTTYYGIEAHFFINHIAHLAIVTGLQKLLNPKGKIIVVSSAAHSFFKGKSLYLSDLRWERKYSPWMAYAHSKLANILFVKELANKLDSQQKVNALHPGIIDTNIWRNSPDAKKKYPVKSVKFGAATAIYLTVNYLNTSGEYYTNCRLGNASALSQDEKLAKDLWKVSTQVLEEIKLLRQT